MDALTERDYRGRADLLAAVEDVCDALGLRAHEDSIAAIAEATCAPLAEHDPLRPAEARIVAIVRASAGMIVPREMLVALALRSGGINALTVHMRNLRTAVPALRDALTTRYGLGVVWCGP